MILFLGISWLLIVIIAGSLARYLVGWKLIVGRWGLSGGRSWCVHWVVITTVVMIFQVAMQVTCEEVIMGICLRITRPLGGMVVEWMWLRLLFALVWWFICRG